jgi:hypothetical protein
MHYYKAGRLADVLALIQVLDLDQYTHRSLDGLSKELQDRPTSSDSWLTVAKEHPEFFRVREDREEGEHDLSLVARHVLQKNEAGIREMPPGMARTLLQAALDIHGRQVSASEWWESLIPL